MKNKESGWTGKVKVAMAIATTVLFSLIIVQCNSKIDEEVLGGEGKLSSTEQSIGVINLPIVPENLEKFSGDLKNSLNLSIANDKLVINGRNYELDEIAAFFEEGDYPDQTVIVMEVDKDQPMKFVGEVQWALRAADKRMILYKGLTLNGAKTETRLLLPPTPENSARTGAPLVPDISELESEGTVDILKIRMDEGGGGNKKQKVYDFVQGHMQKQSTNYVVSAAFNDNDTFNDYLSTVVSLKEGFNQIYLERAQEMFGKDLNDLNQEELKAVRAGVPMAISIAEKE